MISDITQVMPNDDDSSQSNSLYNWNYDSNNSLPNNKELLDEALSSTQDINSNFSQLDNNDLSEDVMKEFGYPVQPNRPTFNNGYSLSASSDTLYESWQFRLYNIHDPSEVILSKVSPTTISESVSVNYEDIQPLHSPGSTKVYKNTSNRSYGSVNIRLVARDNLEADYILRCMNLVRAWTKPYFGINTFRELDNLGRGHLFGAPPPILNLSCYGKTHIKDVAVVLTNYSWSWPYDVDYIAASNNEPVPVIFDLSLSLEETLSLDQLYEFNIYNYKPKDNGLELSPKPSNTGYVTGGSPTELQLSIESSVNEYASLGKSEIYDGGINSIEESNTIIGDDNE